VLPGNGLRRGNIKSKIKYQKSQTKECFPQHQKKAPASFLIMALASRLFIFDI
jgi:hypothetical protein